jgi:hypothetical protein
MGNKLGWLLAGSLVLAIVVGVILMTLREDLTLPTRETLLQGLMDLKTIDAPISSIAGFTPSDAGDAAEDYYKALSLMRERLSALQAAHRDLVAKFSKVDEKDPMYVKKWGQLDSAAVETLKQIHACIAAGARKKDCRYAEKYGPKEFDIRIGYDNYPFVVDTAAVRGWMGMLKDYYLANGDAQQAQKVLADTAVMGWHLMNERAMVQLTKIGVGIQDACCKDMIALARSTGASDGAARAYIQAMDGIRGNFTTKEKVLAVRTPHIGDTLNILEHDEDRAWRVQTICVLGNLKWTGSRENDVTGEDGKKLMTRDDTRKVFRLLEQLSNDSDPMISRAAKWANALTKEQRDRFGRN